MSGMLVPITITGTPAVQAILAKLQLLAGYPLAPRPGPVTLGIKRYFGDPPITALMTVEERGTDKLTITRHPVAVGAEITDHSYMEPAELMLRMMATNSIPGGNESYVKDIYDDVRKLQASGLTFPIQTGKRLYQNMLIESCVLTNDEKSEHALMLQIMCREIIFAKTSVVAYVPQADQANPQATDGQTDSGAKQPVPTTVVPDQAAKDAVKGSQFN